MPSNRPRKFCRPHRPNSPHDALEFRSTQTPHRHWPSRDTRARPGDPNSTVSTLGSESRGQRSTQSSVQTRNARVPNSTSNLGTRAGGGHVSAQAIDIDALPGRHATPGTTNTGTHPPVSRGELSGPLRHHQCPSSCSGIHLPSLQCCWSAPAPSGAVDRRPCRGRDLAPPALPPSLRLFLGRSSCERRQEGNRRVLGCDSSARCRPNMCPQTRRSCCRI